MQRTHSEAFCPCPICGKKPYTHIVNNSFAYAYCEGYLFHKHKTIIVWATHNQQSDTLERLTNGWNELKFKQFKDIYNKVFV